MTKYIRERERLRDTATLFVHSARRQAAESVTFRVTRFSAQSGNAPSAFAHESRPRDGMSAVAFVAPVAPSVSTVAKHDLRGAQFSKGPALVSGYSEDPSVSCFN